MRAGTTSGRAGPGLVGRRVEREALNQVLDDVAEKQPLICLVDDEQWLDRASAQALGFVARRLVAESLGFVCTARARSDAVAGLPELVVEGLGEGDAGLLLDSVVTGPLDKRVRDQIVAETRGNPLALRELLRGFTPAELGGGFGVPGGGPLPGRIEESFRRRLEALPADPRPLLLGAAAAALLERAAMLTPEPVRRAQRLLAAAGAKRDAGAADAALGLLVAVDAGPLDALLTAQVEHLRGQIAFDQQRASDAARLLLSAARPPQPVDREVARAAYPQ